MSHNRLTANTLAAFSGRHVEEPITVDEILGWLLNVSFAALFIFIIASFIFKTKLESDLRQAIDLRDVAQAKWGGVKNTTAGRLFDEKEKILIALQKQQLLKALDEVEAEDRKSFGLSAFASSTEHGRLVFDVDGIISGDKISNNALVRNNFVEGSGRAIKVLPYPEVWQKNWTSRVLLRAEKRFRQRDEKLALLSSNFEVVEKANQLWLEVEIVRRTNILYSDFCKLQSAVANMLFGYYTQNQESLNGTELGKLLNKYFGADEATKEALVPELESKLWLHTKMVMEQQGVMLLSGVQEKLNPTKGANDEK
jgi:tRNA nucleotidyltransferase/poly(A) polymerase